MAQRSRFFDSTAGDRVYGAEAWADVIRALQTDGVVDDYGSELAVTESNPAALSVRVGLGAVFLLGRLLEVYSAAETLALAAADATNPRIDRIVARLDLTARTASLAVLTGTPAATPAAPAVTRTASIWELSLARVTVAAGATSVTNANITDERADATVGGYGKSHDVAALLDPATGHDHDGADSKAIGGVAGPDAAITVDDPGAVGTAGTLARSQHGHRVDTPGTAGANISIDDAATGGVQGSLARAGHGHRVDTPGTAGANIVVDAAATGGLQGSLARAGHGHRLDTYGSAPAAVQGVADAGTASAAPSRGDHKHPREPGYGTTPQAVGASGVDGTAGIEPARGDHRHRGADIKSNGGGAAGAVIWVGTTDPGASAAEGDVWIKA